MTKDIQWQPIATAPKDGAEIEVMNSLMEFPVDAVYRDYDLGGGTTVTMQFVSYGQLVCPSHWRKKTTGDRLNIHRFEPLVEFPSLPVLEDVV